MGMQVALPGWSSIMEGFAKLLFGNFRQGCHIPKEMATVKFCVLALSGLTAAASWWKGFHSEVLRYQLNRVALISISKYSRILSTT